MTAPRCTICIPAWQAEPFIERTLDHAQAQTEPDIAIHVGVDLCSDRTADLCEARAALDPRIQVIQHTERQGWVGNCNGLIDSVRSPYFFLYFHDDLIEPDYVARLCTLLDQRPDAASAHGDVQHFGATSQLARSTPYEGSTIERLFQFVAAREKSPLLRSVTRTAMLREAGVRFEASRGNALGAHFSYVWRFLSLGPALHAPSPLYHRWNQREGGLTESWRKSGFEDTLSALRDNASQLFDAAEQSNLSAADAGLARYAAALFVLTRLRVAERDHGIPEPTHPAALAPGLSSHLPSTRLMAASESTQRHALSAFGQLRYLEADQCERRRDFAGAMRAFAVSAIAEPDLDRTWSRISNIAAKARIAPLADLMLDRPQCEALPPGARIAHLATLGETDERAA